MTTDDKTLTERIARALVVLYEDGKAWEDLSAYGRGAYMADAAAVLPVIRKAERDAAREALDGLADHIDSRASFFLSPTGRSGKAQDVLDYRDTFYPEETP